MYRDLIAVTNRHLCSRPFTEQITRVCKLHPKALILREKDLPEEEYFSLARQVKEICEQFKVPFIPHFYPAVARELGCDRLHLPLSLLLENPKVVSDFHTVGTSIHSVSEAVEAEKLGTSYLTAGHIYVTDCKKGLPPRGLPFLQNVCQAVQIPVYGIGGIKIDEAQLHELKNAGAAGGSVKGIVRQEEFLGFYRQYYVETMNHEHIIVRTDRNIKVEEGKEVQFRVK